MNRLPLYLLCLGLFLSAFVPVPTTGSTTTEAAENSTEASTAVPDESTTAASSNTTEGATSQPESESQATNTTQAASDTTTESETQAGTEAAEQTPQNSTEGATSAPEATQGGDTEAPVTQSDSDPGTADNTTQAADNQTETTTAAPREPISCYECSGSDCAESQSITNNDTELCTSTSAICFMTYNLAKNEVIRSCNSTVEATTSCTEAYPSGSRALNICEYCCTTANCNSNKLLATTCETMKEGAATWIQASSCITLLMSFLSVWSML